MTSSEIEGKSKQIVDGKVQEEANIYEDEINLIDYFLVLWKHKWLIFLGSVLPALIVGLILFLSPRNYVVAYTYDVRDDVRDDVRGDVRGDVRSDVSSWNLNEKNFNVLQSRFYSEENLNKIINKLQQNKLDEYARQVRNFKAETAKKFVEFEVLPPFLDLSKLKVTDPDQLEKLWDMKAFLLNMTITGKPLEDLLKIASVIRENLENVIPAYIVQEQLVADIRTYKTKMSDIESNRFSMELALKTKRSVLEKFQNMESGYPDKVEGEIVLQFEVGSKSEYLPLKYQIQAVGSQLVQLEEQIVVNEAKYKYYENLLVLNQKLFAELKNSISSYYTIQQYRSFLIKLIGDYEAEELKDYLASYIKKIENRISISTPVSQTPKIISIARGTVKKSGIVFVAALMIAVFISFLLEGLKQNKMRNEK